MPKCKLHWTPLNGNGDCLFCQHPELMTELDEAVSFANRTLESPSLDPDCSECILSRQFLRAIERLDAQAAALEKVIQSAKAGGQREECNWWLDFMKHSHMLEERRQLVQEHVATLGEGVPR